MAHSIQSIDNRTLILNDLDAIVFMCVMLRSFQLESDRYTKLGRIMGCWREELRAYAPGAIDLHLEMVREDVALGDFSDLMEEALKALKTQKNDLKKLLLAADVEGVDPENYPIANIRKTISRIARHLISE
jgi:hypothetical protein